MCHGSRLIKENISINGCFELITNKNNDTLYSEHISFTRSVNRASGLLHPSQIGSLKSSLILIELNHNFVNHRNQSFTEAFEKNEGKRYISKTLHQTKTW